MQNEYPSKVDAWLVAVLGSALVLPLGLAAYLYPATPHAAFLCLATVAFDAVLIILVAVPCRYTFREEYLLVQSGILKWKVPYKDITGIEETSNPLSSPALSLQRVKITHKGGAIMVSPERKQEFIALLRERKGA